MQYLPIICSPIFGSPTARTKRAGMFGSFTQLTSCCPACLAWWGEAKQGKQLILDFLLCLQIAIESKQMDCAGPCLLLWPQWSFDFCYWVFDSTACDSILRCLRTIHTTRAQFCTVCAAISDLVMIQFILLLVREGKFGDPSLLPLRSRAWISWPPLLAVCIRTRGLGSAFGMDWRRHHCAAAVSEFGALVGQWDERTSKPTKAAASVHLDLHDVEYLEGKELENFWRKIGYTGKSDTTHHRGDGTAAKRLRGWSAAASSLMSTTFMCPEYSVKLCNIDHCNNLLASPTYMI
jgi:hypothetical protein